MESKPLDDFHRRGKTGRRGRCKGCEHNAYLRKRGEQVEGRCQRDCSHCQRRFNTVGRTHSLCPNCRRKVPCSTCDGLMEPKAQRCGACHAPPLPPGEYRWKRHPSGYMRARVDGVDKFQHVLVMEQALGRPLVEGESVHHLNGVRDDNRPENLELWVRPQPTGVRARDAYAWALAIVERYEGVFG